jgi:site-specific DNA recombinase
MRLIVQTRAPDRREPDPRLIALLAKAHDWFARLSGGEVNRLQSIAQQENVSSSYVVRVVQLAFLAPEISRPLRISSNDFSC